MNARFLAVLLVAAVSGLAGDGGFDQVVKAIESHYSVKRTHIPFLGVANVALKFKHPSGVGEFHLAIFENLDSSPLYRDLADRDRFMRTFSGHGLHPMIAVRSRSSGESTYIYMADAGKYTAMLIATFQNGHATVVEVKTDAATLLRSLQDPEGVAHSITADSGE